MCVDRYVILFMLCIFYILKYQLNSNREHIQPIIYFSDKSINKIQRVYNKFKHSIYSERYNVRWLDQLLTMKDKKDLKDEEALKNNAKKRRKKTYKFVSDLNTMDGGL